MVRAKPLIVNIDDNTPTFEFPACFRVPVGFYCGDTRMIRVSLQVISIIMEGIDGLKLLNLSFSLALARQLPPNLHQNAEFLTRMCHRPQG